jgi:hypothetical protein
MQACHYLKLYTYALVAYAAVMLRIAIEAAR